MSYEILVQKLKDLPEQSLVEVSEFFDYMSYKYNSKGTSPEASEGLRLLDSIVGIIPSNITLENAKSDYFGEKHGTSH